MKRHQVLHVKCDRYSTKDGCSTASETLFSSHHTTWYNSGNHDF